MTNEQIEQAAQDHADKYFIQDAEIFCNEPWNNAKDLYAKALADFAKWCMSNQWISVQKELPADNEQVLVISYGTTYKATFIATPRPHFIMDGTRLEI